jgi:trimeric autotransporter adhesin
MYLRRCLCCLVGCLLIIAGGCSPRSRAQSVPRIKSGIVENSRVSLRGNTLPVARVGRDLGPADATMPADRLLLVLQRSPAQETALRSYLDSVQDPGSPDFRKFLTPEQFGSRFGIADGDLDKVTGWLRGHGFQVAGTNRGRTVVEFSGTIGQLEEAFQVPIHAYYFHGAPHLANAADPSIPSALSPVVAGIASLNDVKPRPMSIRGPRGIWSESAQRIVPDLTVAVSNQNYLFVTPGDAATIYDAPNALNTNLAKNQTQYDGTGVTIGVVGNVHADETGVINYRSLFGLPSGHWTLVVDGDEGTFDQSADQTEAMLDSEVSGGLAPGANVIFYAAGDTLFQSGVMLAIYRAIDDNNVSILSVSYGACEANLGAAGNLQILQAWEQAAAQGIAVTVSSGDAGSAGCDDFNTEQAAQNGLAVSGFASTPYNIAVGGTDFDALKSSFSNYVSSTNTANYTSALKYIPETPWNDSTATNGTLASNTPLKNSKGQTNIVAGSGGASSLGGVDGTGNSIPYPKPQWQQNFSASDQDSVRDLPDVSLLAGNGLYGAIWGVCEPTDCAGGSQWTITGVGGTSASAPSLAGILALVNQKVGASTRLGQPNWVLYQLAQSAPSAFHQVTGGNNSVYCQPGSPNCNANGFLSGYNAGASYNFATGLGSVDASSLVNNWSSITLTPTTTTLSLNQTSFVHGTPVNITATVSPSSSTGSVAIINSGGSQQYGASTNTGTTVPLNGGTASGTFAEFPGGKYNVYANYGGDGSRGGSTSQPIAVNVTPENSVVHLFVDAIDSQGHATDASGKTLPLGTFISMNAQPVGISQSSNPKPITNATGTVGIYDSFDGGQPTGNGQTVLDSTGTAEWNSQGFQAGTHAITAYYNGDLSYNSSTSPSVDFTILPVLPSISLTSNVSTIFSGSAILTAAVSAPIAPDFNMGGTVTFTDTTNSTVLGTGTFFNGCQGVTTQCGTAVLDVNVNQLASGTNSINASYSGDTNFTSAGPSVATTVTCTAGCSNGTGETLSLDLNGTTPSNGTISPGQSSTTLVGVAGGGGFTGAVNLTCTVTGKNSGDAHIPTCSFSPSQVTIGATGGAQSNLVVNTTAGTSASLRVTGSPWKPATVAVALLFLWFMPLRHRRFRTSLGLVLLLWIVMASVSACGGGPSSSTGSGGGGGSSGTTADTYTVTFRAADAATGTVTAQDYFSIIVQ